MVTFERPMPVKTPTTAPFWDALAQHRIVVQYSPSSQAYVFYPRVRAPRTLADDLEWREISGMGTLYSYTVAHRPVSPHFAERKTRNVFKSTIAISAGGLFASSSSRPLPAEPD